MRILFCGTPDSAVPSLRAIASARPEWEIPLVLTQPDRGSGRGLALQSSPVKKEALRLGLPVETPERLGDPVMREKIRALQPDVIAVVAYGKIFRSWLLDLPPHGCVNLHFSLLPRHRGMAPVTWALLEGDERTGVSTMRMDPGVDTGPVYLMREMVIEPKDTTGSLTAKLAELGAGLLVETLRGLALGTIEPHAQVESGVTYAKRIDKEDGRIDWSRPAQEIERKVRALDPWPNAFTTFRQDPLKVLRASVLSGELLPGVLEVRSGMPVCGTGDGILALEVVQAAGKNRMEGAFGFAERVLCRRKSSGSAGEGQRRTRPRAASLSRLGFFASHCGRSSHAIVAARGVIRARSRSRDRAGARRLSVARPARLADRSAGEPFAEGTASADPLDPAHGPLSTGLSRSHSGSCCGELVR